MPLVVDACNVLHVVGILPADIAGIELDDLVALIGGSRYRHARATLVCDGPAPGGPRPGHHPGGARASRPAAPGGPVRHAGQVTITWSGPGRSADDLIAALVHRSSAPRRLTVVSSDRAVQREARRRRCATLSSEDFLRHLALDHERSAGARRPAGEPVPSGRLRESQVQRWVETFAISDGEMALDSNSALPPLGSAPLPDSRPAPDSAPAPPAPPPPDLGAFLPRDLLEQAERLLEETPAWPDHLPPAAPPPAGRSSRGAPKPAAPLAPPVIPLDLVREAWRLERDEDDPAAPPLRLPQALERDEDQGDERETRPPLPPEVIEEAESIWREDVP